MSTDDVADAVGRLSKGAVTIGPRMLRRYEAGEYEPKLAVLSWIALALGLESEDVFRFIRRGQKAA